MNPFDGYEAALAEVNPPFAFVDLDALGRNLGRLVAVASGHGKLVRLATKSIRCLAVTRRALALSPDVRGLLTFTLAESLWLAGQGLEDLVVAYPTADTGALAALDRLDAEAPVLMVDSLAHVELIERHCRRRVPVCLEVDLSLWLAGGRVLRALTHRNDPSAWARARLGPLRSPVRTVAQAVELARHIAARPGVELVGVMGYEGHVAGVGDRPRNPGRALAIQAMQRAARRDVARRRAELVAAIAEVTPLEFVNGGGTGSVGSTAAEAAVTEVTVGSGLYAPALFDHYRSLRLEPAAYFVLPVVRRPGPGVATLLGGGYVASGAPGADRLPVVAHPAGLRLDRLEGAGEVQTPVLGTAADTLHVGDRVYLRHAKAGELCERFDRLHLLSGGRVVDQVPTYRGEGHAFL